MLQRGAAWAGKDQLSKAMAAPLPGSTAPPAATCESDDLVLMETEPVINKAEDGLSTDDYSDEAEG
jgi:hypothetical protein